MRERERQRDFLLLVNEKLKLTDKINGTEKKIAFFIKLQRLFSILIPTLHLSLDHISNSNAPEIETNP